MDAGFLSNKVILILSPQHWGNMLIAKHHYAIELAKRGNEVYFLNPPDNNYWSLKRGSSRISISTSSINKNLFLINHQLYFPYNLKFHSRPAYNFLIKKQIRDIVSAIKKPLDIIWSFDLGNLFPLGFFNRSIYKVFHPVDEPGDQNALKAGEGADIIFSVTREILSKYVQCKAPSYFINHGLADEFLDEEKNFPEHKGPIKVGLSGNLLRPDIDQATLIRIVSENSGIRFHFYGSYQAGESNVGSGDDQLTRHFIAQLKSFNNVILHGVLNTRDLAVAMQRMDALLICYDIQKDQSKGTNYHKVMEYLSTGRVIISNNISTYKDDPELVCMIEDRSSNEQLPGLFKKVISDLDHYNSNKFKELRISYSRSNRYTDQLEKMDNLMKKTIRRNKDMPN